MAEPIQNKIKQSLQAAEGLYYRLVLLVGESGSGKTGLLRDVAEKTTREGPAQGVRGVQRGQEKTQSLPSGSGPHRIQKILAGTRLCDNHRRGRKNSQQNPRRRSKTAHVV